MRQEQVKLENLGFGAAAEMFQAELEKVIFNVADPNTKPDVKRGITLKLSIKPSKDRSMCAVEIHCDSKLAAVQPFETTMFVGVEHGGGRSQRVHGAAAEPFDVPVQPRRSSRPKRPMKLKSSP